MDKNLEIQIFCSKVKDVRDDDDITCDGCVLSDICSNYLVDCSSEICSRVDGGRQKFIGVD